MSYQEVTWAGHMLLGFLYILSVYSCELKTWGALYWQDSYVFFGI